MFVVVENYNHLDDDHDQYDFLLKLKKREKLSNRKFSQISKGFPSIMKPMLAHQHKHRDKNISGLIIKQSTTNCL